MSRFPVVAAVAAVLTATAVPTAAGQDGGTAGRPVEVRPASQPLYGTAEAPPETVRVPGGPALDLETWRPAEQDGHRPPAQVPVVLVATAYGGTENAPPAPQGFPRVVRHFTSRGYAVSIVDVPGTGGSSGCTGIGDAAEAAAVAAAVRHVARAPWSTGSVGMYGLSYDALTQLSVATRGLHLPELKALVPVAPATSTYLAEALDGVPYVPSAQAVAAFYTVGAAVPDPPGGVQDPVERQACSVEHQRAAYELARDGGYSPYFAERDGHARVARLRVPTLLAQGLADSSVFPVQLRGLADRVPAGTPFRLVLGQWGHRYPDAPGGGRADWMDMATAWFDQWVKGVDTGVLSWPAVQVASDGDRWRGLDGWPSPRARHGQLALAPGGVLGGQPGRGEEVLVETAGRLTWSTGPLEEPLHLTGNPVLDLHVVLDADAAHLVAEVRVVDAAGAPVGAGRVVTHGARSARHLAPMAEEHFTQEGAGTPAPVGVPLRVPVRLMPVDVVVPAGGRLEVELDALSDYPVQARRGAPTRVTVLRGCATPSVLRFDLPEPRLDALDVPVVTATGEVRRSTPWDVRGPLDGGLARKPVCGQAPVAPSSALPLSGPA